MTEYPVRRLLALFQTHEALPRHPDFVLATVKPLVAAELTAWFCNSALMWECPHALRNFADDVTREFDQRRASRDLTVVNAVKFTFTDTNVLPTKVQIQYTLMWSPGVYSLEFNVQHMTTYDRDTLRERANALLDVAAIRINDGSNKSKAQQ